MSSLARVKRLLVGNPIPTDLAMHERLSPATGLAVFASDALSSVAYATEEILLILVLAGGTALYLFLAAYAVLLGWGGVQWLRSGGTAPEPAHVPAPVVGLSVFLVLRAFASGCAALTGIEAVSDGVPAFRPPEARNARAVLAALGVILVSLFIGISVLSHAFGVVPI